MEEGIVAAYSKEGKGGEGSVQSSHCGDSTEMTAEEPMDDLDQYGFTVTAVQCQMCEMLLELMVVILLYLNCIHMCDSGLVLVERIGCLVKIGGQGGFKCRGDTNLALWVAFESYGIVAVAI